MCGSLTTKHRVADLTEVHRGQGGSLGDGGGLVDGVQQLLLGLADRVAVQQLHWHAEAIVRLHCHVDHLYIHLLADELVLAQ